MTLFMVVGLTILFCQRTYTIYATRETEYSKRDLMYTEQEMRDMNVTLGKFNNSLNFITGLSRLTDSFDVLNNPYIHFAGNAIKKTLDYPFVIDEVYEFEHCNK